MGILVLSSASTGCYILNRQLNFDYVIDILKEAYDCKGAMVQGREWILAHGCVTTITAWGDMCLSLFGSFEWSGKISYEDDKTCYICFGLVSKIFIMPRCWVAHPSSVAFKLHLPRFYDCMWVVADSIKKRGLIDSHSGFSDVPATLCFATFTNTMYLIVASVKHQFIGVDIVSDPREDYSEPLLKLLLRSPLLPADLFLSYVVICEDDKINKVNVAIEMTEIERDPTSAQKQRGLKLFLNWTFMQVVAMLLHNRYQSQRLYTIFTLGKARKLNVAWEDTVGIDGQLLSLFPALLILQGFETYIVVLLLQYMFSGCRNARQVLGLNLEKARKMYFFHEGFVFLVSRKVPDGVFRHHWEELRLSGDAFLGHSENAFSLINGQSWEFSYHQQTLEYHLQAY